MLLFFVFFFFFFLFCLLLWALLSTFVTSVFFPKDRFEKMIIAFGYLTAFVVNVWLLLLLFVGLRRHLSNYRQSCYGRVDCSAKSSFLLIPFLRQRQGHVGNVRQQRHWGQTGFVSKQSFIVSLTSKTFEMNLVSASPYNAVVNTVGPP